MSKEMSPQGQKFTLVEARERIDAIDRDIQSLIEEPMGGYGLPRMLRVSVGSRRDNQRLLEVLP